MKDRKIPPPPDIRLVVEAKNNLILAKMEEKGYKTVAELCRAADVDQGQLGDLIKMKVLPTTRGGEWRTIVLKLSDFLGCLPDDLFSKFQQENVLDTNRTHAEMHFGRVQEMAIAAREEYLLDPTVLAEEGQVRTVVAQILGTLPRRYQAVLRARFGIDGPEMSLEEIATVWRITRGRVHQIEKKALRLLRHPRRSALLKEVGGRDD